ncbi:HlyD family efflux transporter periplasmic adaptor subunit [Maribacter litopenaei]|uniref:HlyD family efflux transporter periplasmic adaptor subunit n=1 Tax=Maribacter litopenaei TaxID=2976127 RepID=A0ABY5Y6K0_9FLAO|nr:HlyD family efflux transporter periplasmic adaptor subunit [Maribacter litopenaei]UWX54656.1 HlyD family efflux transporter periplasmic adaptor subunit [Maribacter litopenaei]
MKKGILFFAVLCFVSCGEKTKKVYPKKMAMTESVYASVTIQPDSLYQAYAAVSGILSKNLLEEGDLAPKGTPLVQIINTAPELNAQNARLNLELAEENYQGSSAILTALEDEIKSAQLSLENDSINFFRQKRLWEQQIGSKAQYENRKLAYELSRNNFRLITNRYERTKNELATQWQQARNNYRTARSNTEDFTVESKINGKVYALFKEPGEIVNSMEPLATVGSKDVFIIEMLVDEVDIVKLTKGQKVLVTLDAYKNEVFEANVHKIYPKKDQRSQTFKVEATFMDPPKILYPGLAGEGNIIIAQKDNVLTLPKSYLINENQVQTEDGPVTLKIGLQSLDLVEILDGINETTAILKPEE